jgi:hypothetical protein
MNKKFSTAVAVAVTIIVLLSIILVGHQISIFEGAGTMSSSTARTIGMFGMIAGSLVFVGTAYILYNYMKE